MEQSEYNRYKTEIYRIGWRLQYRAKKIRRREHGFDREFPAPSFTELSDNKVAVEQILRTLSSYERTILQKIYLEGLSEAEVAHQFNITQQGVNKCKRKLLQNLSQTANF
ncbi:MULTISPECIES: sigma factor-like helix-turn-helix DNA-binding protein [Paenibacillus]|uniref:sigma factor-like helix-turn-helix DNA-binding protein n=1 Tax=Paenibacillus TaxID=44249 RepID=UPI00093CB660|nr:MULTISPECIES: sigma factor-like helix-turn-helix DNA-binding protein [Paenibacillus]